MIDIHCHVLPGIDDGPETLAEAVEMCRIAADDGVGTIVATPHYRPGMFENTDISGHVDRLQHELSLRSIPVRILPGADVVVTPELSVHLAQHPQLTINGTGRYVLAELPHDAVPARWEEFLLSIRSSGITPIITHPERNRWFLAHPDALFSFVTAGGLVQITAMSILGANGHESREYSRHLLKRGLVHVIASDAHSVDRRPPLLSGAVRIAGDIVGADNAVRMVNDIPQRIIDGRPVELRPAPLEGMKKRAWFQRIFDL